MKDKFDNSRPSFSEMAKQSKKFLKDNKIESPDVTKIYKVVLDEKTKMFYTEEKFRNKYGTDEEIRERYPNQENFFRPTGSVINPRIEECTESVQ